MAVHTQSKYDYRSDLTISSDMWQKLKGWLMELQTFVGVSK